jgi:hypothetical protein
VAIQPLAMEDVRTMTEAEWLTGTDPKPLVQYIAKKASHRKLRLFALAVCVVSWRGVVPKHRDTHAVTEAFEDGAASVEEMRRHWGFVLAPGLSARPRGRRPCCEPVPKQGRQATSAWLAASSATPSDPSRSSPPG